MIDRFETYLLKLRETPLAEHTEHTGRAALEALLNQFAKDAHAGLRVQHEPKREKDKGAPDFKVSRHGMILGYVEVKEVGTNLDKILKSDQIKRYRELSDNIILTDYLQWIWIDGAHVKAREGLSFPTDLDARKIRIAPERAEAVGKLIAAFFSEPEKGIGRAQQLALALATRSKLLREFLGEELIRQQREHQEGRLFGLFQIFRDQVFHELTTADFADAFAQMLAYGLFLAKLNADTEQVTLHNARQFIPGSFRLIRELVDFLTELEKDEYREVRWVVEEVLSIVNGLNLPAIHEDLSFRARRAINRKVRAQDEEEHRLFERDPFIYFYEDYLKAYDAKMRKSRGVYYTPPPIVNFIVRAVDDVLKDSFGIREGLADSKRVTVLDFACGTGTFLLEVFQRIFDNIGGADKGRADPIVREHILKNIYGFEYLIAPYTIAHLKLSQFLKDCGHALKDDERLQVFLTNTLEPIEPQTHLLVPAITAEVKAAQAVKDKKILVITGNPPYAGHSKNPSERVIQESVHERRTKKGVVKLKHPKTIKKTIKTAIGVLIEDYKLVDGEPLGETNPKWLQDDYVKFIRFAQNKMDAVEEGIVAIITNHSYLDNATFRGMRPSLMRTFDSIYIVDLHGSTKPKEPTPAATKNENVFDIQKGVAIALFVKKRGLDKGVWFNEFWGSRQEKYETAARTAFSDQAWQRVQCVPPYYMFRPLNWTGWEDYHAAWPIADSLSAEEKKQQIFELNVLGFQTHRDHFAIAIDEKELFERAKRLIDDHFSDSELAERYSLKSNSDWKVANARAILRNTPDWEQQVIQCAYRPFDNPFCFFGEAFMDRPRRELVDHVAGRENLQLLVSRQIGTKDWRHVFVADAPPNDCVVSDMSREANYCFPVWLYGGEKVRAENLSQPFRAFIDAHYKGHHYEAEQILGYIYAILHTPSYRRRYAEFLRIDFPRIPFADKRKDFETLSRLGAELIEAHLLKDFPRRGLADYHGRGDNSVEKPRYVEAEERVFINDTQSFAPVPKAVWEFHIGGYQVLDKYLKSRKGRTLSLDEINHFAAIADVLAFTIEQMEKIDDAWRKAFPDRG